MSLHKSLQESQDAVSILNKQIVDKALQSMPNLKQYFEDNSEGDGSNLPPIPEADTTSVQG